MIWPYQRLLLPIRKLYILSRTHLVKKIFYYKWYVRKPWR